MPDDSENTNERVRKVGLPGLLRAARNTYGAAIRKAVEDAGFSDVPRNGLYVLGAISRGGSQLADIIKELGVSKQAAGQLVDTLVLRGYLARNVDAEDRRRLNVELTARGQAVASISAIVVDGMEAAVVERLGSEAVAQARAVLLALIGLRPETEKSPDAGVPAPPSGPRRFSRQRLDRAVFHACAMPNSVFDDINLSDASFSNVNLANSRLTNVNMKSVTIEDANIAGLTIMGHDIQALINAKRA
jgi:DNA-binding MarR family transcriptional regulator